MEDDRAMTAVLTGRRQGGAERDVTVEAEVTGKEDRERGKLLALKVEEGALSQGIQVASRSGRG